MRSVVCSYVIDMASGVDMIAIACYEGDVAIALTDERGLDVPVATEDNNDGTFTIRYEPKTVGNYTTSVFFGDQVRRAASLCRCS